MGDSGAVAGSASNRRKASAALTNADYPPRRDVLIVSSPVIRAVFHDMFAGAGYECLLAANGRRRSKIVRG